MPPSSFYYSMEVLMTLKDVNLRNVKMNRTSWLLLGGATLGAGLMYILDPEGGRRRRALARDKAVHLSKTSGQALGKTSRDLLNRSKGVAARTLPSRFRSSDSASELAPESTEAQSSSGNSNFEQETAQT